MNIGSYYVFASIDIPASSLFGLSFFFGFLFLLKYKQKISLHSLYILTGFVL